MSASGEALRRLEIWESEEPESLSPSFAQVSSFSHLAVGPAAAGRAPCDAADRCGAWEGENLES